MRGKPPIPFETRFARSDAGCLEWQGAKNPQGYGHFKLGGRWHYSHRYAWELANGPIPAGMFVLHHCDNPGCGDVDHLFLGTQRDNMRDSARKNRSGRVPWKLTEAQVEAIRRDKRSARIIGEEYGVTGQHILRIRHRQRRGDTRRVAT